MADPGPASDVTIEVVGAVSPGATFSVRLPIRRS
jgi:hypothetical protein